MEKFLMRYLGYALAALLLGGCAGLKVPNTPRKTESFSVAEKSDKVSYVDKAALAEFEAEVEPVYRLGEGDHLNLQVWNRPELSGKHVLGPDGQVTIPLIGPQKLLAMTREEAAGNIKVKLNEFYTNPIVDLGVDQYQANRVTVLGRVLTPGILQFDKPPVLLDVLARAGSMPVLDKQATLTRAAVFRGREKIIWVDLKTLLNRGDLAYNIRLKPNDLVYIPDSSDTTVYVMGAVAKPGAYRLTPNMSYLDALAQAGGPTEDAETKEISLYRPGRDAVQKVPFASLLTDGKRVNYALEEGDIIYVPKRGLADVGYVMRQLLPGLSFMTFGATAAAARK
ncbi:MAG: SLBB domain-containing protein [Proteobacteria bacterium]|nr:SLBB domain-containing protein [Pseudomonadota bacterium]